VPFNETEPYTKNHHGNVFFHQSRTKLEDFYESEKYFLTKNIIKPNMTILDIGCASGGLGAAIINSIEPTVKYTGIDVDSKAIELGKKNFPDLELIKGAYPKNAPKKKYDMVVVLNLFEQIPDWKDFLLSLTNHSNKFVNIGLTLRKSGPTIIDKEVSYGYYYDSGVRVHKIIHNIYELMNFCCVEEMRVKKISFYGYHIDRPASHASDFRPLPQKEQIRGNLLLELPDKKIKRIGGFPNSKAIKELNLDQEFTIRPDMEIIIDKKHFEL
jgi:2-polyprenyl-3-methyl-5-hydroxy-6-metoxy-1,4-benzoquinol methylase